VTRHVLSIDLGTSRAKLGIVNDRLEIVSSASASYPTYVDRIDMAEQRPDEWIDAIAKSWKKVHEERPDIRIDVVVLTAQMPTLVELDGENRVIGRAVTWQDSRSDELVGELLTLEEQRRVRAIAGTPIDGRYLIPMHLRRRREGMPAPSVVLSAKDYLFFELTGRKATDPSTASGFGNYDLEYQQFSDELSTLWGFDIGLLPSLEMSSESHPLATTGAEILTGLEVGRTPVVLGSADSVAAFHFVERAFGAAVAVIDGSSTVILGNVREGQVSPSQSLVTPLVDGARTGLEMDLLATGSSISWLARLFGRAVGDLESLARSVESKAANAILFEPYLAGGEQGALWRTDLSGTISNLHLGSTQGDIALALFEGIAFEVTRCLDAMEPIVEAPTVVWLMSADNAGLLPALLHALDDYRVICVPGLSPSLLGAALVALEVLHEKPDLRAQSSNLSSDPFELDVEYVAAIRAKRARYLATQATST
jgi:xylulokinase